MVTTGNAAPAPAPRRSAIAMWDFSWLTRRSGDCAEYADVDAALDGLVLRGYDMVRIDAFPHLVSWLAQDARRADRFTLLPEPAVRQWGNPRPVDTAVRAPLLDFIGRCRERHIRVALSSWFGPDTLALREAVVKPADYCTVWRDTLRCIADAGLLDAIAWVDLCNEFPFPVWARGAYRRIFGTAAWNLVPFFLPWPAQVRANLAAYADASIPGLRAEFGLPFTFSSMRLPRKEAAMPLAQLDFIETHAWLSDTLAFNLATAGFLSLAQVPGGTALHARLAAIAWPLAKERWRARLSAHLDQLADIAAAAGKPLVTTEGWATTIYGGGFLDRDRRAWDWIKEAGEAGVELALARGWQGLCTSNYSQPHFPAVWNDIDWHRRLTARIHQD
jgi:hypothetical protein